MNNRKSISLPEELWKEIDIIRGEVSRSRFIKNLLDKILKKMKGGKK